MLLGPTGQPIDAFKKDRPKALGPSFGAWADRDATWNQMPGGAILQFDLSRLTLADFRAMRWHPMLNLSLSLLTFMLHQMNWHIKAETPKIAGEVDDILRPVWTRLIRAMSQSLWAGYSPCAIEYENNLTTMKVVISKIKDLVPEDCQIHWKEVEGGYAPPNKPRPKFKVYDGIDQWGMSFPIPPEHSIWYPLLMENGDMYGRKLLKSSFTPWYFSTIIHLFANRYYERFGEPMPVGRAPFDDEFPVAPGSGDEAIVNGKEAMETILMSLRNRGVVTLPSDRNPTTKEFEYSIEYLESQMRGADFEKYLTRLDEEMSLGLFTPLLLFRTGTVGSNALGVQHTKTWLWVLNALAFDMKEYIDRYVITRIKAFNYGPNAPDIEWIPHKLGGDNVDTLRSMITALISKDKIKPDIDELGQSLGMTLTEVKTVTREVDPTDPAKTATGNPKDTRVRTRPDSKTKGTGVIKPAVNNSLLEPRATTRQISDRIRSQVERAWREKKFGPDLRLTMGYRKRFITSLVAEGYSKEEAESFTNDFYSRVDLWSIDALGLGMSEYTSPSDFMSMYTRVLDSELDRVS